MKTKLKALSNVSSADHHLNDAKEAASSQKSSDLDSSIKAAEMAYGHTRENKNLVDNTMYLSISNRKISYSIEEIEPNDIDLRFDGNKRVAEDNDTSELEDLIRKSKGNTENIYVRPHPESNKYKYQIIKGIRRTLACRSLSYRVVALIADFTDQEGFELALHENLGSQPLNNFELSESLLDAVSKHGYSIDEASKFFKTRTGKPLSRTGAYKILDCAKMPKSVKISISDKSDADINTMSKVKKACDALILAERESFIKETFVRGFKICIKDALLLLNKEIGIRKKPKGVFVNNFEGKEIKNQDGLKVATIATQPSGSPMIRFTKNIDEKNLEKIVNLVEEIFNEEKSN